MQTFELILNIVELVFYTAAVIYILRRWKK